MLFKQRLIAVHIFYLRFSFYYIFIIAMLDVLQL